MLKRMPGSALLLLQQKKLSFQVCLAGSESSKILSQSYPPGTPALLHLKSPGQEGRGFPTVGKAWFSRRSDYNDVNWLMRTYSRIASND